MALVALMSTSGLPSTRRRSARWPGAMVPKRAVASRKRAASPVAARRTSPGERPAATIFTFPGAWDEIDTHYQERGWTDGLPIVPPTERRVHELLKQTPRDPREVVGVLPPRQGEATVEKIAVNAVMAGCRPEYFPVVLAAIEALADPLFNLDSVQATTHPVATLLVVNGPITRAIGLQAGYGSFGQGFRANLTIGRAVRLVLMNVGGGLPGSGDRATQGTPAKIAYCVAENEAESPWEPLHVEAGLPADIVHLGDDLALQGVWRAGRPVSAMSRA